MQTETHIRLHLFKNHEYIFDHCTGLSEMDYAVKVWGPILETVFENTEVILKWYARTEYRDTSPTANFNALG